MWTALPRWPSALLDALVLQRLEPGEVQADNRRLERVDVGNAGAVHGDDEAIAEDHDVLAAAALVPLLVDHAAVLVVGLLVAVVGFLVLIHVGETGQRHDAFR